MFYIYLDLLQDFVRVNDRFQLISLNLVANPNHSLNPTDRAANHRAKYRAWAIWLLRVFVSYFDLSLLQSYDFLHVEMHSRSLLIQQLDHEDVPIDCHHHRHHYRHHRLHLYIHRLFRIRRYCSIVVVRDEPENKSNFVFIVLSVKDETVKVVDMCSTNSAFRFE